MRIPKSIHVTWLSPAGLLRASAQPNTVLAPPRARTDGVQLRSRDPCHVSRDKIYQALSLRFAWGKGQRSERARREGYKHPSERVDGSFNVNGNIAMYVEKCKRFKAVLLLLRLLIGKITSGHALLWLGTRLALARIRIQEFNT